MEDTLSKKVFTYTGCDNLEAMTEAVNYNHYLIDIIKKRFSEKKKVAVLDFGAGSGTYADMLKEQGVIADCLEPDKKLQRTLTKKGYKVLNDVKAVKPKSYDIIYALNVMEHVENDHDVFDELVKALKKDGLIIIYVPAFQVLYSTMDELVGHYRRYRKNRLRTMATRNNLEILDLYYCDPIGFGAALAYKAVGSKEGRISPKAVSFYDKYAFPVSKVFEPLTRHLFGKNVVIVARNGKDKS